MKTNTALIDAAREKSYQLESERRFRHELVDSDSMPDVRVVELPFKSVFVSGFNAGYAFAAEQIEAQRIQFNDAIPAMKEAYQQGKADAAEQLAEKGWEIERLKTERDTYKDAAEMMIAAFDTRPDFEPPDITKTTQECALSVAKQDVGWLAEGAKDES